MINKSDVVVLINELQTKGINMDSELNEVMRSNSIPLSVLKKINDYKSLDIVNFYEKLRRSYNNKKSKLYINILKSDENVLDDPRTILTTLSALLNQILQFKVEDKVSFYNQARADEIVKVLELYFKTYNLDPAMRLLNLYKADMVVLEYISGHRATI